METLSYGSAPCCQVVNSKWKLFEKSLNSRQSRVSSIGKVGVCYTNTISACGPVRFYSMGRVQPRGSKRLNFKVCSGNYDGYVIGEEEARDISGIEEPATKVLIPGLPDDSNGESGAPISSCFWGWKPKLNVHYEKAGCENVNSPHVLFLPGFGVGSFHYEKQMKDLGRDYRVWALDFLGQGMSLPFEDPAPLSKEGAASNGSISSWGFGDESEPWATKLVYSVDLWQDQVRGFIEEVIGEPVYLVGNSLGGLVALYFAACNPHLVKGVTLLNATPFWGFLPNPIKNPRLAKIFPWAGTFPLPSSIKRLTELLWEKISDPKSIAEILSQVYADHSTNVDNVFSRIVETTRHPAAAASFASIMFAPQGELSFSETLSRCRENNVSICLMYGKEDPWVGPVWGLQVKRQVPEAPYYQISPAGHCPHDEVPEIINFLLRGWIRNLESQGSLSLPLLEDLESMKHTIIDRELEFPREDSKSMKRTLSRYNKCLGSTDATVAEIKTQKENSKMVEILREEIAKLETNQSQLLGKDMTGLGLKELQNFEQQLNEGLLSVKARKEELLMEQLEQSRVQEQRVMLENETLRRQIEELRCLFPQPEHMVPFQYQHTERKNTFVNTGARCLNLANNCGNEKGSSDTAFHLGLPAGVQEEGPQERNLFK